MLKRSCLLIFILFLSLMGGAQSIENPCDFNKLNGPRLTSTSDEIIGEEARRLRKANFTESADSLFVIPVVVHIIHNGGSENIADTQVFDQMRIINEDFRRISGTNGFGGGVDCSIQFCLAKKDPSGNCTNGIIRVKSPLTLHQSSERALLQNLSAWDNKRYLNVYVVRTINGNVGGYAAYPGGPYEIDGIVVRHDLFGSINTSTSLGRTFTHEAGHWLGLYHVFHDGCGADTCSTGDLVCDTPPQSSPSSGCVTSRNTCSNDIPDLPDQVQNYMDYSSDICQNMFTKGQKERMRATLNTLRKKIRLESNLVMTGCDSNYVPPSTCPVVANFVTLTPEICEGNQVQFHSSSLNSALKFNWTFVGGNPSTSTDENPLITYPAKGDYAVKLVVFNGLDMDNLTINNYIKVSEPGIGRRISFAENFNNDSFPPQGITIDNPDGEITWELDSAAAVSGRYSIRINNMINTNYGTLDEIILPYFDFTTASEGSEIFLSFNWAYARGNPTFSDELSVLVSTDCAANFEPVFRRSGAGLASAPTQSTPFIPDSSQWRSAKINLKQFKAEQYLRLKFVNVTDGGNNLYIDDIYIGDGSPPLGLNSSDQNHLAKIFPNPAIDEIRIQYDGNTSSYVEVLIYDLSGVQLLRRNLSSREIKESALIMDIHSLSSGQYILGLIGSEGSVYQRFMVKKE